MTDTPEKSPFEALLDEVGDLAKSMPAAEDSESDERIEAAAEEGEEGDEGEEGKDEGEPMGKSYVVKAEDGSEIEVFDGADMLKALTDRVDGAETANGQLLTVCKGLITMVKSLQGEVTKLGAGGRGRRTVLTVHERTPAAKAETELTKSDPAAMGGEEFLVKALDAQKAGRVTSMEVAQLESYLGLGLQPPAELTKRVIGA